MLIYVIACMLHPASAQIEIGGKNNSFLTFLLNLLQKNVGACQISKYIVSTRFRSSIPERDLTRSSEFLFETTSPICLLTVSTQQNKGKGSWRPKKVGQHLRENRLAVFQFQQWEKDGLVAGRAASKLALYNFGFRGIEHTNVIQNLVRRRSLVELETEKNLNTSKPVWFYHQLVIVNLKKNLVWTNSIATRQLVIFRKQTVTVVSRHVTFKIKFF